MKTEYIIITSKYLNTKLEYEEDLVEKVNGLMKEGWEPLGNPFQDHQGQWLQALIK